MIVEGATPLQELTAGRPHCQVQHIHWISQVSKSLLAMKNADAGNANHSKVKQMRYSWRKLGGSDWSYTWVSRHQTGRIGGHSM